MAAAAVLGLLLPACGEDAGDGPALVDTRRDPPIVGLEVEPRSRAILLSTNRGLFRIGPGSRRATRIRSVVRNGRTRGAAGPFLTLAAAGPAGLIGSGHPERGSALPPFLGLMTSADGGRTWKVRSRAGLADLHVIRWAHGRVYALDAVLDGLLVGSVDGDRWRELRTPSSPMLDLAVDPTDPSYLLASDARAIYRSKDGGRRWRPAAFGRAPRLTWRRRSGLVRADADGRVSKSSDRGVTWGFLSQVEGEPMKLTTSGENALLMALSDGTLLESKDGGSEWQERFRP